MYLWFRWVGQSTTAALLNPMRKPCVNLSLMNLAKVGSGCVAKTGAQVASSGSMPGRGGGNSVYGVCLEEALSICTRFWVYLYNACMMLQASDSDTSVFSSYVNDEACVHPCVFVGALHGHERQEAVRPRKWGGYFPKFGSGGGSNPLGGA